jgi:hypothetical protein
MNCSRSTPAKLKLLEVYHGMPQLVEADATGRAVLRAWQEMLELLELNCENPRTVPDPGQSKPDVPR